MHNSSKSLSRRRNTSLCSAEQLEDRILLTNYTVTTASDVVDSFDGFISLREALQAANSNVAFNEASAGDASGDTITFSAGLNGQSIFLNSELTISDDVTISFPGREIVLNAGQNNFGVFNITTTEQVTLQNMELREVRANRRGGAIILGADGNLSLDRVEFVDNRSHDGGAVLLLANAKLNGNNLTFTNNSALGGTGNSNNGGAIVAGTAAEVQISNSTFTGNTAARDGGAIDTKNRTRTVLTNVSVADGSAGRRGGGLSFGTLSENHSFNLTVSGNAAPDGGGIVVGYQADYFGDTTTVRLNTANGTGNRGEGGGMFVGYEGKVQLFGATFDQNEATRGGGGIEVKGDSIFRIQNGSVTDNDVSTAKTLTGANPGQGGGIRLFGSNTEALLYNVMVTDNVAQTEGGGIWVDANNFLTIDTTRVERNQANGNAADQGGGGIFNNGGTVTILERSTISANQASGSLGSGGGIFSASGKVDIRGPVSILGNVARRAGGGIEIVDGELIVSGATIGGGGTGQSNRATGGIGNGGGIHVSGTNGTQVLIKDGTTIASNVADLEGGGIWNQAGSTVRIQDGVLISRNQAGGTLSDQGGGGIFNNGGTVSINDGTKMEFNSASGTNGHGGAILSTGGRVEVYFGSSIESNSTFGSGSNGGGVAILGGTFVMGNSRISNNVTGGKGGGIYASNANNILVKLTNRARMESNRSTGDGGGIHAGTGTNLIIERASTLVSNSSVTANGGGVFNNGGTVTVSGEQTLFSQNSARNGGGIYNGNGGSTIINDSRFVRNSVQTGGGGVFTDGTLTLNRAEFFLNNGPSGDGVFVVAGRTLNNNGARFIDDQIFQQA